MRERGLRKERSQQTSTQSNLEALERRKGGGCRTILILCSLYIPTQIPTLPPDWQTAWSTLTFPQLSQAILSLFIPTSSISSSDLQSIIDASYSTFRHPQTTPLRQTGENEYVLELWHGPTWAFKDVALQFLGNVFAYFLERRNREKAEGGKDELTVLGATSGDTGRLE